MRLALALSALGCGFGCSSGGADASLRETVPSGANPVSAVASGAPARPYGPAPAQARRDSAPPEIAQRAVAEGALAPAFSLPSTLGEAPWSLEEGLSKADFVVLVFYRGAW